MTSARFLIGDTLTVARTLPDASVDLIVTSPPFLALRSYLPDDHPDKALEIGAEPGPAAFVDTLLALTAEWRRILAPHGSIFVELGDTYSGSGGAGGDYGDDGIREGQPAFTGSARRAAGDWPEPKSLALIPELYRIALAYGRNPLTGAASPAGRWKVRNVVRWHRPNPPVGALGDKFRPSTSDAVIACTSRTRYFDLDAVRTPHKEGPPSEATAISRRRALNRSAPGNHTEDADRGITSNPAGAPPLDTWVIPTAPYAGSHYAVFPPALVSRPIEAMTPRRVCLTCGTPSHRITEQPDTPDDGRTRDPVRLADTGGARHGDRVATGVTVGWTTCGCPGTDGIREDGYHTGTGWRLGIVLDPFAGSGTTLAVATGHGRAAIGIDIDERNSELALDRVGPIFLTIERPTAGAA